MKTIKTQSNDLLIIEVPKLSFYFDWNYSKHKTDKGELKILIYWETKDDRIGGKLTDFTDSRKFNILGKLSELNDKDLERFVENNKIDKFKTKDYYKDYINKHATPFLKSAKQSFISLLQSNEIDTSKELLIIEVL